MTATLTAQPPARALPVRGRSRGSRGRWVRFGVTVLIALVVLIPIVVILVLALKPPAGQPGVVSFANFANIFSQSGVVGWLLNSLVVTLGSVVVSVAVAAPAGYVLSRGRGKLVGSYSLLLFVVQSLPIITAVIPLFILFANFGLTDSLLGLVIIYVGQAMAVATWMMAAYFDTIPMSLEEAAWIDGASLFGSFSRIVLRNSLPGVLSTAIFTFLLAWNDYLVAVVFIRDQSVFTLPIGVQSFFQQNLTDWGSVMAVAVVMMAPPVLIFAVLNKYFSVGGIGGSLAGR